MIHIYVAKCHDMIDIFITKCCDMIHVNDCRMSQQIFYFEENLHGCQ